MTADSPGAERGPWRDAARRLAANRAALLAAGFLLALVAAALLGPPLLPHAYDTQDLARTSEPPSRAHWLGTDALGRDLLARLLVGARISLAVGLVGAGVSLCVGVLVGSLAGMAGGWVDDLAMRAVDFLYGLPYMFLVIIVMTVAGEGGAAAKGGVTEVTPAQSFLILFIVLGAFQWMTLARIVRGQVLALKAREFVEAAYACGATPARVLRVHILPNLAGPVIVYTTLTVPMVILQESFLSFLGLGIRPPLPSWGGLAADALSHMNPLATHWWLAVFPGLALAATLLSLNFLGDGLRDALDPRLRGAE